jgi:TolA-binding protein
MLRNPSIRRPAATLLVTATAAGLLVAAWTTPASAAEPSQMGFVHGSDFYEWRMDQYADHVARMSADDRSKLKAMQDKLMQMEMDRDMSNMKMDMDIRKMQRDIQMFIFSAVPTQDPRNQMR